MENFQSHKVKYDKVFCSVDCKCKRHTNSGNRKSQKCELDCNCVRHIGKSNPSPHKGKTYEEIYGVEKAAELKELRRKNSYQLILISKNRIGKSNVEIFGEEKAKQIAAKKGPAISAGNLGKPKRFKEDHGLNVSKGLKIYHQNNVVSLETRRKQSQSKINALLNGTFKLPLKPTKPAKVMAEFLENSGLQVKIEEKFGKYSVDIYLPEYHLGIEIDGEYWHNLPGAKESDIIRENNLFNKYNLSIARYTDKEIEAMFL